MNRRRPLAARRAAFCALVIAIGQASGAASHASERPVSILAARIGGHIHPSICRTNEGTLVAVYKGANVLMCSRSSDGGATWDQPTPITTSAKRPDVLREVKIFEVYPGTADTLPDGRVLVTWNYIADDKKNDGYYERALLYSVSADQGRTWSEQVLIGPVEGKHLGAVRHNVLAMSDGRWLLPLRVGPPRLYDPKSGELTEFRLVGPDGKQHSFQQIVRTAQGSLVAMGPVFLRSRDDGRTWTSIANFPAVPDGDSAEGRYLTTLADGGLLVTWGVGNDNKGLHYNYSGDDGRTWNTGRTVTLLPETNVMARFYSARTVQVDERHVGSVFMNRDGVHFLKVPISAIVAHEKN
ncbi:MAG: sialidase family protein [Pirellulales bacterium]